MIIWKYRQYRHIGNHRYRHIGISAKMSYRHALINNDRSLRMNFHERFFSAVSWSPPKHLSLGWDKKKLVRFLFISDFFRVLDFRNNFTLNGGVFKMQMYQLHFYDALCAYLRRNGPSKLTLPIQLERIELLTLIPCNQDKKSFYLYIK